MAGRPRLAVFTPLAPQPSGIASYNAELLLPALAERADVIAVVDDDVVPAVAPGSAVPVVGYREYRAHRSDAESRSPIYHLGNHVNLHRWIHDALLEEPGLVVLHDPSLFDFYLRYHAGDGFADEVRHNYGDVAVARPEQPGVVADGADRLAVRLERRVAEAARGVIVHSVWAQHELAARCPTASVFYVPLAAPVGAADGRGPDLRERFGWTEEHVVFGLPAAFAAHKRAAYVVQLFRAVYQCEPRARLLVSGRLDDPAELERVQDALERGGLTDAAAILVDVPGTEFDACLAACDVVLDLRWPSAGEVPASLLRAFGAGTPAIVSDLPQLRHLEERFCWRVPPDPLAGAAATVRRMVRAAGARAETREGGRAARAYVEAECSPDRVAARYLDVLAELRVCPPSSIVYAGPVTVARPVGVNALGDFEATTGLMEAGRRVVSSLAGAGADVALTSLDTWAHRSPTRGCPDVAALPAGRPHAIDLWLLNINEFPLVPNDVLRPDHRPRHTLAYWFWELPQLPSPFPAELNRVDEVWVASRFVREALRGAGCPRLPIRVMPCPVEVPTPPAVSRAELGLNAGSTTYFFHFDARSTAARKNPWAVIDAFREAFPRHERGRAASLVIKVLHLDDAPGLEAPLREALDQVNGTLIAAELTRSQMNALLASTDVYVSLHHSEGFGLGIAEAMFLGKPAVVTAFSGNMDFTDASNSCLVGYQLRPIENDDHRHMAEGATVYPPGLEWAHPSVDEAARWMRLLHDEPQLGRRIGSAGATTIRRRYSRSAVQAALVRRLGEIQAMVGARSTGPTTRQVSALAATPANTAPRRTARPIATPTATNAEPASFPLFAEPRTVENLADCWFYTSMEIPGVGPVEGPWDLCDVDAYLGHVELKGKRVLEIGPASGFLTFTMERRGATVVSIEQPGWPHFDVVPRPRPEPEALAGPATEMFEKLTNGFWFTHRAFGSSAQVHYGNAYDLPDALGVFDISVVACVLLHNRDPMKILQQCAERTTEQLVVVEPLGPDTGRPVARLLPAADNDFVDGWWALTPEFISQALGLLGFAHRAVVLHEQRHRTEPARLFTVVGSR